MSYIFIDESGDLGFDFTKSKTSKYFVITFLFSKEKTILDRIIKDTFKMLKNSRINHSGTLHAFKESPKTRTKLLTLFQRRSDLSVITIYLNKKKVYTKLHDQKDVLYNYVTNILLDRVCSKKLIPINEKIRILASRRQTNKFLNENFKGYIKNSVKTNHKLDIEVEIVSPSSEKGLQVVDMLSWSIYRKYEHGDYDYYNLIKNQIIEENPLFP